MALGTEIEFDKKTKAVLDKFGLSVSQIIDYGYDRRDFFPDTVSYEIARDNELIFTYSCRSEEVQGRKGPDGEFATEPFEACLKAVEAEKYLKQASEFKSKLKQLLELRKDHKFSKFAAKKELKDECENLCRYYSNGSFSTGAPNIFVNVPLMEDNKQLFQEVLKELEALQAEWENNKGKGAEAEEAAGPANE